MNVTTPNMGFMTLYEELRESGFALRHPRAAWDIWFYSQGSNNISTIAVLFASNIGLGDSAEKEGTQINAFRHTLWQAIISNEYGNSIAKQVGNSHEENPIILQQIDTIANGGLVVSSLLNLSEADTIIDLRNNIIGRKIGSENKNSNNTKLATIILDEFKENGLYVAEDYNSTGFYKIIKQKIDDEIYKNAIEIINNGLDSKNKERQNERG